MKCLNCGKEIKQIAGKRARQYCNDACRKAYGRSNPDNVIRTEPNPDKQSGREYPGGTDCQCQHCKQVQTNKLSIKLNHSSYKPAEELGPDELNRVSLPGDSDYIGAALPYIRQEVSH